MTLGCGRRLFGQLLRVNWPSVDKLADCEESRTHKSYLNVVSQIQRRETETETRQYLWQRTQPFFVRVAIEEQLQQSTSISTSHTQFSYTHCPQTFKFQYLFLEICEGVRRCQWRHPCSVQGGVEPPQMLGNYALVEIYC